MATSTLTFGDHLKSLRHAAKTVVPGGLISPAVITGLVNQHLPMPRSEGYLNRLENGTTSEEKADVVFMRALANVYQIPLEELSTLAALRWERLTQNLKKMTDRTRPSYPAPGRRRSVLVH